MPYKTPIARNAYSKAYYQDHKGVINDRMVAINRRRRHDRYEEIQKLKAMPCTDCERSYDAYVMDFDHRDPTQKTMDVSLMVKRMFAWKTVLAEIVKCDIVCACCHRKRTYHGDNNYRTHRHLFNMAILNELKATTPCLDCGGTFLACQMDFDHLGAKVSNVARLVPGPQEPLLAEIRKCHLVCANCHRIRGFTGVRKDAPEHPEMLIATFLEIAARTPYPQDGRRADFPWAPLVGTMPDKEIAKNSGVSQAMVAWVRRKRRVQPFKRVAPW